MFIYLLYDITYHRSSFWRLAQWRAANHLPHSYRLQQEFYELTVYLTHISVSLALLSCLRRKAIRNCCTKMPRRSYQGHATQMTHYATQKTRSEDTTNFKTSAFAHGLPAKASRDQRNVNYAYSKEIQRNSPQKNTRKYAEKPNSVSSKRQWGNK